ncbi:tetratricopeptide repeat protein [bacterium]|nr:tetratricopeptide repeat protein [bacterium]MBU1983333.1 tetratricopeptide repeat protein [bacterium]
MKRTFIIAVAVLAMAGMVFAQELASARLYKKQGEWLKSLDFYNQVLEKAPSLLDAYFERGELYYDVLSDSSKVELAQPMAGETENPERVLLERMVADFQQATIEHTPKDKSKIRKFQKAIDRMLQTRWNHHYFIAVLCDSLYDQNVGAGVTDPDPKQHLLKGVEELDLAIVALPAKWNAYGLRAQILGKLTRADESLESWNQALERIRASDMKKEQPDEYEQAVQVIQGKLLQGNYSLNRYRETVELADQILAKDSANIDALQFKAFALAQLGTDESMTQEERNEYKSRAITALEAAKKARPDDPTILYYIGQFNLQLADTAAALAAFNEFLTKEEKDRDVLFALGVIYLEGGTFADTVKARDTFAKLVEHFPDDGAGWTNYGVALIRLREIDKGREAIEKGKTARP